MTEDRVKYSTTLKVSLPDYGSMDVGIAYESSVQEDETPEEAYARVVTFVKAEYEKEKVRLLKNKANGVAEESVEADTEEEKPKKSTKSSGGLARLMKSKRVAKTEEEEAVDVDEEAKQKASEESEEKEESTSLSKLDEIKKRYKITGTKKKSSIASRLKR